MFQGPQEAPPPGSLDCVWWSGGWGGVGSGAGQGCRGGNSSPGEPKTGLCLTPGATPAPSRPASCSWVACCFSFLPSLPPPPEPTLPCAALHGPPSPGSQEGTWRTTDQRKKDCGGPPPSPAGRPFTLTSFTQDSLSAWSANTLPALGRAPPHPGPVSEIAHDYCKRRSRTGKCEP